MSGMVRQFQFAQSWAPMAGFVWLAQGVTAAPVQGPWLPCSLFSQATAEVYGTYTTVSSGILLANSYFPPMNGYKVAVGGTVTPGDVLSITVTSSVAGVQTVNYTVASGNTLNQIAASLAILLAKNAQLAAAGFLLSEGSGVIVMQFPSLPPGYSWSGAGLVASTPASSPPINYVTVSTSVSNSATETMTVGLVNNGPTIQTLNATSPHALLPGIPARWVQGNVSVLTGAGAIVDVNMCGVA